MRLVAKDLTDKPAILADTRTLQLLEELSRAADPSKINDKFFQDPYKDDEGRTQSRVRDKLNVYYFDKCAYCETYCKAHIEHYRPKKGVTGAPGHAGYYWLCYEWSNLIPSCPDCNTFGGKGNQFPIRATRVTLPRFRPDGSLDKVHSGASSAYLQAEQPYLLHPEHDDALAFLGLEPDPAGEGLKLAGLDVTNKRGEQTIRICNLNRKSLKIERLNVLDGFVNELSRMFKLVADGLLPAEKLERAFFLCFQQLTDDQLDNRKEHTFLRRFMLTSTANFDALVLPRLSFAQRAIVQQAFRLYKNPI